MENYLLISCEGSWNDAKDTGVYGRHTNVVEFHKRFLCPEEDKLILSGVGTRRGRVGKLFGGAFGVGAKGRVREALAFIQARGDKRPVVITGFSRGAATAIHLANELKKYGIQVYALLLWDLVGAFGIPIDIGPIPFQRWNFGYNLTLPRNVVHCRHVLAMDENRAAFYPTTIEGAYEVWFKGSHSDVGGGNENPMLSNISLRWMIYKAHEIGLPVDLEDALALPWNSLAPIKLRVSFKLRARFLDANCIVHQSALKAGRPLVEYAPDSVSPT